MSKGLFHGYLLRVYYEENLIGRTGYDVPFEFLYNDELEDIHKSLDDADRLKKENKARLKRLSLDKKQLLETIDSITYTYNAFTLENEESKTFLDRILNKVEKTREDLLTELEKL